MDATLRLGGLPELRQLLPRPFRLDVAWRDDRNEGGHVAEPLHQRVREGVITGQLRVAPDFRWFAEELPYTDFKRPMQVCDPSFASFDQPRVVHVRVADEGIPLKIHDRLRLADSGRKRPLGQPTRLAKPSPDRQTMGKADSQMGAIEGFNLPIAVRRATPSFSLIYSKP